MYRVVIVDDEPAALAHLCNIIEKKCKEFVVTATAENGQEGLKKVLEFEPDVVLTDIRMPGMSGLALLKEINGSCLNIYPVIVSGYQDFAYAKEAIQNGGYDYILKPVLPAALQDTMERIADALKMDYYQLRNEIISHLCAGGVCDEKSLRRAFPYEKYYGAIIRRNGLPRRFSGGGGLEIYSDINEYMTIYGRDEMESLYLVPEDLLLGGTFKSYITKAKDRLAREGEYLTMVYDTESFTTAEFLHKVKALYKALDKVSIVGFSQVADLSRDELKEVVFNHSEINLVLKNLEQLMKEHQFEKARKNLIFLYELWEKERKPQVWLEYVSRQIINVMCKYGQHEISLLECEYMMEDAFYESGSAGQLRESLLDIFFSYIDRRGVPSKVDSPEFFEHMKEYLTSHLDENITLQAICHQFGVSQTYISKLFRKYTGASFNHYFVGLRMERAKELMLQNKDFYVKDIARMVGYEDQFYFSRIFRSYTGESPSDYLKHV